MTSSIVAFTVVLFVSLALAANVPGLGSDYQLYSNNIYLTKAIEDQQKVQLELAAETTKLNELNKLRESEGIDFTTSYFQLSKWQSSLLNDIKKSEMKIQKLTAKAAASANTVGNVADSAASIGHDEKLIYDRTKKLVKALEEQQKIALKIALETTKLEALETLRDEPVSGHSDYTKLHQNILNDISKTQDKIKELNVDAAVTKTEIDVLQKQVVEVGGSLASIPLTSYSNPNEVYMKVQKAEKNQIEINMKLARATQKLQQLESRATMGNISGQNIYSLSKKQKKLLKELEEAREKQYELIIKATQVKTLIEQLRLLLPSTERTLNDGIYNGWQL